MRRPTSPPYVLGTRADVPRGTNRMQMSIYTPHTLAGATVDGEAVGMESQHEAGYRVYSRTLSVAPGQTVVLSIELEGQLAREEGTTCSTWPPSPPCGATS